MSVNKVICLTVGVSLLSSCAFLKQPKDSETPNHSWKESKEYNDQMGGQEAGYATVAYSQGNFKEAEAHVINALEVNPKQPQALLVGALLYEQLGRTNRARQYYEDLIVIGGTETTILGTDNNIPQKMSDIAKKRLRLLVIRETQIVVENPDGSKGFNISGEASEKQGRSAMEEALFKREQKLIAENKSSGEADRKAVEVLFSDGEKNIISRFLILKEMAEKDLITKDEFLNGRMSNIGGILPLTNNPPAYGVDKPVPSADLIIERIQALKDAVEARAITPREFSSERNLIVEAILPPHPRTRMKNKAPAKDILGAAKEIRKIEVLYDLNLITSKEKENEQAAIEKYLGLTKEAPKAEAKTAEAIIEPKVDAPIIINQPQAAEPKTLTQAPITPMPDVTTPF